MNVITDYLLQFFDEIEPKEFYREIFPEGELQQQGEYKQGVYNGIVVAVTDKMKNDGKTPLIKRYTVTEDLRTIDRVCETDYFCLMSPISYAGKSRTAENARFLYAFAVDLDHVRIVDGEPIGLRNLWERHIELVERVPKPTFIVSSGTGLHLYYVLDHPIALYSERIKSLQRFKFALTELIWHDTICDIKSKKDIQQEGIYQGFRVPGTITKTGERARAFRTGDSVSMEYMNGFLPESHRVTDYIEKGHLTLKAAKEKYPEWFERRIVKKEPKGVWHVSRNLYEWWKRQILSGATVGHRYHCLRILAIYAQKCSMYDPKHNPNPVTEEELERDAWELLDFMDSLTLEEENHFDKSDVLAALESFNEKWIMYPRASIEYRSGIEIVPSVKRREKGKRLKQEDHLEEARMIRDLRMKRAGKKWTDGNGRKSKENQVTDWIRSNPNGSVSECAKDLQISRTTVYKYWK